MVWGLLSDSRPFFDLDFDGHFGLSDVLLVLVFIAAIAAAAKIIHTVVVYLRARSNEKFAQAVMRAIQPQLDRIHMQLEPNGGSSLHDEVERAATILRDRTRIISEFENRTSRVEEEIIVIKETQQEMLQKIDLLAGDN